MSRKSGLEVNGMSTFTVMLLISLEFRHSLIHHIFNGFPWWDAVDEYNLSKNEFTSLGLQ